LQTRDQFFTLAQSLLQLLIPLLKLFGPLLLRTKLGQQTVAFQLVLPHGLRPRPSLATGGEANEENAHGDQKAFGPWKIGSYAGFLELHYWLWDLEFLSRPFGNLSQSKGIAIFSSTQKTIFSRTLGLGCAQAASRHRLLRASGAMIGYYGLCCHVSRLRSPRPIHETSPPFTRFSIMLYPVRCIPCLCLTVFACTAIFTLALARAEDGRDSLRGTFEDSVAGLLDTYCSECHNPALREADIDLQSLQDWKSVQRSAKVLQQALEQLHTGQMPPPDAKQLSDEELRTLKEWLSAWLTQEAERFAGDPGPVVLRRLNNAEYTYTIRDLTGLPLDPAREFPADSAAGEGFSNTGAALVMSPALVQKYLDAGKKIAEHAVLLPDGFRFEAEPSPSDMTNSVLERIRNFYARYTDSAGGETVNLQGIVFETNQGGRLPVERYLAGTIELRDRIASQKVQGNEVAIDEAVQQIAESRKLNAKYLRDLWQMLSTPNSSSTPANLMSQLRQRWQDSSLDRADALSAEILTWQRALWRFSSVGHIGKLNGPKAWQEPVDPIRPEQEIRFPVPSSGDDSDVTFYLQVTDAGDGAAGDIAWLERPRLVAPGRPEILLRDLTRLQFVLNEKQMAWSQSTDEVLAAIERILDASQANQESPNRLWEEVAQETGVPASLLRAWAMYLGLDAPNGGSDRTRLTQPGKNLSGYEFVDGWVAEDALSIVANASQEHLRIPGNMPGRTLGVHPSPSQGIGVSWRAPHRMLVACSALVRHAHTECGNGVAWRVELRRGTLRQTLSQGYSQGANDVPVGPHDGLLVRAGDELVLLIEPRDGNHSCDLTNIDFDIRSADERWNLTHDVVDSILESNPHADTQGRPDVWEFFSQPVVAETRQGSAIPSESLLAQWLNAHDASTRKELASRIEHLVVHQGEGFPADTPDGRLYRQIVSARGPMFMAAMSDIQTGGLSTGDATAQSTYGIDTKYFGRPNARIEVPDSDCIVPAPSVLAIRIPSSLASGTEFVTTGRLHPTAGREGSVQFSVTPTLPENQSVTIPQSTIAVQDPNWTTPSRSELIASPIVVPSQSEAEQRIQAAFGEFRRWFPIALCYPKIVPVDEVVTLTLFYREDEPLQRLMLSDEERNQLDRLWNELHYVSQDALKLVDAYEQLWQYATQDADPSAFEPLREPIRQQAEVFREQLAASELFHLNDVVRFAATAYRGAWTDDREGSLRKLYTALRRDELSHPDAIRFMIARILVSPEFLYRLETPGDGERAAPVSPLELANRLSYFLWSSPPDAALLQSAREGTLVEDAELERHVRRMLKDPKADRMAVEFGSMWLHIRDFDQLDEKSETHFPEFQAIRSDLYREALLMISDRIVNEGSVLDFLDADHTFLNEQLAAYYGIPGVSGPEWRRVDGIRAHHRGGILAMGATLAKQSGASRTSPILRGTWLSEVVLGEKLPKPPKNVPVLAELPPAGVTERELIELHSSDPACMKCHQRIDPYGFALEGYDAIGRFRKTDALGLAIDTRTTLPDGTAIAGFDDLRQYLSEKRREDFVCQFHRKLLGYALGRSVQLSDQPWLNRLLQEHQENEYRISDAIVQIVLSQPFRQIRGREYHEPE